MKQFKKTIFIFIQIIMATTFVLSMFSKAHAVKTKTEATIESQGKPTDLVIKIADSSEDPLFFRKLRQELDVEALQKQAKATKDGVLKSTAINFIPTNLSFMAVGGLIYFTEMAAFSHSDPTLMIKQIESLKDPIGYLSFGMFMLSQGMFLDFKTKGMDPLTKRAAIQKLLYRSIAVGSIASSFTADALNSIKSCTLGWNENRNDENSHRACDQALEQWTWRNKTVQYVPQIMSLLFTQVITDGIEKTIFKAKASEKYLTKAELLDKKITKVFNLTSASINTVVTPGGWIVKGVSWLGNLSKFGLFLGVDHLITPSVTRFGNNLMQPLDFEQTRLSHTAEVKKSAKSKKLVKGFNQEIKSVSNAMAKWRSHLNGKNELDLMGWNEATNKLLHQITYAKSFYANFIENVFKTKYREHLISLGIYKDYPELVWVKENKYPYRTLPLFGVTPVSKPEGIHENDIYLSIAHSIEPSQSEQIFKQVKFFKDALTESKNMPQASKVKMSKLLDQLLVNDTTQQGRGLYEINRQLMLYGKPIYYGKDSFNGNPYLNAYEEDFLTKFRKSLGDPRPQFLEGASYAMAFDTDTKNFSVAKTADFDLSNFLDYKFTKPSDLMFFQMICGANHLKINESFWTAFSIIAPRIVDSKNPIEFCNTGTKNYLETKNLYNQKITVDGVVHANVIRYLMSNIEPDILGQTTDNKELMKNFNAWWNGKVLPDLNGTLHKLDERFKVIVDRTYQQIINDKTNSKRNLNLVTAIDWISVKSEKAIDLIAADKYLGSSLEESLKIELEFYLKTFEMILQKSYQEDSSHFDKISENALAKNKKTLKLEVLQHLKSKYNELYQQFYQEKISADQANEIHASAETALKNLFKPFEEEFSKINENSDEEFISIYEIYKGLLTVLGESHRLVMLKVQLSQKLSVDMGVLNQMLEEQKANTSNKQRGAAAGAL